MEKETEVFYLDKKNADTVVDRTGLALENGSVCIIPTDTIYGIVALDRFEQSVNEIYRIKGRSPDKPFIRLIGSLDTLSAYTKQPLPETLGDYWPGPLTIIFNGFHKEKIAIRFPDDEFLQKLFKRINFSALVAPSANISGKEDIFDSEKLIETFFRMVDLIVCRKEALKQTKPSTIIDISEHKWRVIREGAVKVDGIS